MGNYIKSQDGSVAPAHMIQLGAGLKMTAKADSTLLELSADGGADWAQNDPNGNGYVKNRPFYEKERIYKLEGSLSGRDVVEFMGGTFYKVSDDLPARNELDAGVVYDNNGNKQFDMSSDVSQGNETVYIEAMAGFFVVFYDNFYSLDGMSTVQIPSAGVYLADRGLEMRLGNIIKTIDKKFLPDGIGGDADWNTLQNKPFYDNQLLSVTAAGMVWYKVSSDVPANVPSLNTPIYLWTNGEVNSDRVFCSSETAYGGSECLYFVALTDNAQLDIDGIIITLPERGTYFLKTEDIYVTGINSNEYVFGASNAIIPEPEISWDGNTGETKQLDEKFIPEMTSVILKSSTADSTKRFKITVDDSGTLSATEVTT